MPDSISDTSHANKCVKKTATGRIEVVHGSMFAGKTEYLIARLRQLKAEGRRVIAFKHDIDDRYDPEHLVTHRSDRFDAVRISSPEDILDQCNDADVVAVDEGQFFKMPLIPVVEKLAQRGKIVLIAGITHDAWGRDFEPIPQLAKIADEEILRQAPCRVCGQPAPFTQRITPIDTPHMIGGLQEYEPRCATPLHPPPRPPPNNADSIPKNLCDTGILPVVIGE